MAKKEDKTKSIRKKFMIAGLILIFFVLILTSFFGQRGLIKIRQEQRKPRAMLKEKDRLEREISRLEKEIEELKNNPNSVEMEARKKLWLMKKDELVLIKKKK